MEKPTKFYLTIPFAAAMTLALLAVPLIAMQFSNEVNWSISDFIIMGALIFGTSSLLVVALRATSNIAYRAGLIALIGATFLLIWVNMAVGIIGSGPNLGNLLYIAVLGVLAVGIYLSRFKAAGMERAMFVTALTIILVGAVALLSGMQHEADGSVKEIISVSLFFAAPYLAAGLLFRFSASQHAPAHE